MNSSHIDTLRKHCGKYRMVKIHRNVHDSRDVNGFVLDVSDSLVLVSQFSDFEPDGFCVLRLADIDWVRSDGVERAFGRILAAEGKLDAVGMPSPPAIDDMDTLLRNLAARQAHAIVEIEDWDEEDTDGEDTFDSVEASFEEFLAELREGRRSGLTYAEWLAGEDEDEDDDDEEQEASALFLIGRVLEVEAGVCWVRYFDAEGVWELEPRRSPISSITCVQLQTPYLDTWLRHLAPFPGAEPRPSS